MQTLDWTSTLTVNIVVADGARDAMQQLADGTPKVITWLERQLNSDLENAGVALTGALLGNRCLTSPEKIRFIFTVSLVKNTAYIKRVLQRGQVMPKRI